jgi:D-glycero-D-manno-heptose 1,7-bisphosphate phosphatase
MVKNRAVFIDRDGVLNKSLVIDGKPYAPKTLDDFIIFPDISDAVKKLKKKGFILIVVTNQPDVGNGIVAREIVVSMNAILNNKFYFDSIKVCFHSQSDNCSCRKPKPGMLLEAASEFQIDLNKSFMVGDRKSDVDAGNEAGCYTFFIDHDYRNSEKSFNADNTVKSFSEAVNIILSF